MYNDFSWNISVDFIMNHNYNQASEHTSEWVVWGVCVCMCVLLLDKTQIVEIVGGILIFQGHSKSQRL